MAKMPPPERGGSTVVIAVGPKPGAEGKMPPPGMEAGPSAGQKATPDEAKVVRADQHCIDCENYSVDTGECAKVQGTFAPEDGCHMYFTPAKDEPDEDDEPGGGAPDNDADDSGDAEA